VRRFVLDLDRRLEPLDRAILVAEWDLYTGRSTVGAERWQLKRGALLSDDRLLGWVRRAMRRPSASLIRRRLELLERILLDVQVEQHPEVVRLRSSLTKTMVAFRPEWKGKKVNRSKINRILQEDPSQANRRRAFYALEPLYRPMEEPLRALVRARNERARTQGFRTFAEMRLGFEGVTPSQLEELSDAVVATAPNRMRAPEKRFRSEENGTGWFPWDFAYALRKAAPLPDRSFPQQTMLPRILKAIQRWGFRTQRMRFRVVFHDLPAGGLTLAPAPPHDVRILVHPRGGWPAYHVMFHEVGHAVHSASIRAPAHLLSWHENIPGFGGFHEGIGKFFEGIAHHPGWLAAQPGVSRSQAEAFARERASTDLWDAAWVVPWVRIEQALYRNPDGDPSGAALRAMRRMFGYDVHPPRSFVDSFYVDTPVYGQNYLLAILFHHHLVQAVRERFGDPVWPNPRVGPWLTREWFAPGSIFDWVPRVRSVMGRPFSAAPFQEHFRVAA
jgi:hypothetical protein